VKLAWFARGRRLLLKVRYRFQRANNRVRDQIRAGSPTVPLESVQRRLELLLAALYGRAIPIAPVDDTLWNRARVRRMANRDPRAREATPSADAETIYLPAELTAFEGDAETVARYRLMAIEQAERIVRGTAVHAPLDDPLERDLYLLREGAAVDATIARAHPGIADLLARERTAAIGRRPKIDALSPAERDVETLVRATLSAPPGERESASESAAASREWARAAAQRIRRADAPYRGLPQTSFWGTVYEGPYELPKPTSLSSHSISTGNTDAEFAGKNDAEDDQSRSGDVTMDSEEGRGEEADPSDAMDEGDAHATAGRRDAQRQRDADSSGDKQAAVSASAMELSEIIHGGPDALLPAATMYDEWHSDRGTYVKRAAAVRIYPSEEGEPEWARATLAQHAATVRQVRHQFERLRARRTLLSRQRAGDELDIAACVSAVIDRRIGRAPDDRVYLDARPARRGLAIALLVDTSGSTEARVTSEWRIIDLEKIAVLLATQALDALGDLYAVYSFAGRSASNVQVRAIKDFSERNGDLTNRRIAALESGGFTRLGAAVRHATRQLAKQSAGHRLLLLLSDGRPNDVDVYQGDYGVEDSRQAIFEARGSGVYPFCLTIDREASEYLPRIFGQAGHTILQEPRQLPNALVNVVRALIRRQS
jgi:nitric oxide reductase NorD protein